MRLLCIFSFLLLSVLTAIGQTDTKTYNLIIGSYIFKTSTIVKRDPVDKRDLREYSDLYKNEHQTIKIPSRIDRILRYNPSDPSSRKIEIDTVDHIDVRKIVDTITLFQLNDIINSEIQIYRGTSKLTFDEAHLETIQASGSTSYTIDLQKTRIREGKHAFESVSALKEGGLLILHTVWFYDSKNHRQEIECSIAWAIK